MDRKFRRYVVELAGATVLYVALAIGSVLVARSASLSGIARYVVWLLPMLGAGSVAWAVLRHVHRIDELQRRTVLEAIVFAFAVTALGTFAWGFAEVAGAPKLPTFAVWPIMAAAWIVGGLLARRRYH